MPTIEHKVTFDKAFEGIVNHVKRHKVAYSLGAGIAVAGITCLIVRGRIETLALRGVYGPETADTLVTTQPIF